MGDKSKIAWTEATWNPTTGCSKVSEGCRNCYALDMSHRLINIESTRDAYHLTVAKTASSGKLRWTGRLNEIEERLQIPLRWRRPRRVFVNSMSDLFHEKVTFDFIDKVFAVMALSQRHVFQVLTKRPERMKEYFEDQYRKGSANVHANPTTLSNAFSNGEPNIAGYEMFPWPLPNVWLGVSVEDQATADERIPLLLETPAAARWISAEPLLGPLNLRYFLSNFFRSVGDKHVHTLDWVVVGGESGPEARPMHPDWVRTIRDDCKGTGTAFFMKQWGEYIPVPADPAERICVSCGCSEYNPCISSTTYETCAWVSDEEDRCTACIGKPERLICLFDGTPMLRIGKSKAGHLLDGVEHFNYPEVKV